MDDATNEHYAMAFVEEEGTASSFQGVEGIKVGRAGGKGVRRPVAPPRFPFC